jgi:hypothetical protein
MLLIFQSARVLANYRSSASPRGTRDGHPRKRHANFRVLPLLCRGHGAHALVWQGLQEFEPRERP